MRMGLLDEINSWPGSVWTSPPAGPRSLAARWRSRAATLPPPRSLAAALTPRVAGEVRVLAELKRASPIKGALAEGFDPVARAREYVRAGAAALSVLTDAHFQGSLADLDTVRALVECPVLEKDFVVDEYQLWEARAHGADAILLIVAILDPPLLTDLFQAAKGLGLSALVEVHREGELDRAAELGAGVIGINNRDLTTFRTGPPRPPSGSPSGHRRAPAWCPRAELPRAMMSSASVPPARRPSSSASRCRGAESGHEAPRAPRDMRALSLSFGGRVGQ